MGRKHVDIEVRRATRHYGVERARAQVGFNAWIAIGLVVALTFGFGHVVLAEEEFSYRPFDFIDKLNEASENVTQDEVDEFFSYIDRELTISELSILLAIEKTRRLIDLHETPPVTFSDQSLIDLELQRYQAQIRRLNADVAVLSDALDLVQIQKSKIASQKADVKSLVENGMENSAAQIVEESIVTKVNILQETTRSKLVSLDVEHSIILDCPGPGCPLDLK